MRLLLDEMYSPAIAEQLREGGYDAVSVRDTPVAGRSDADVLAHAIAERRALVTENVADFAPLLLEAGVAGETTAGTIFTSPRSMPRSSHTIGAFVDALTRVCGEHPGTEALADQVIWLGPTPG